MEGHVDAKRELTNQFAELMASVVGRIKIFSLEWPYEELGNTQVKTLILLSEGSQPMRNIASSIGVVVPSATRIVDSLVHKGLVERSEDNEDRRRVLCSLTEEGRLVMARLWKIEKKRAEIAAQLLNVEQLSQIVDALQLLDNALVHSAAGEAGESSKAPVRRYLPSLHWFQSRD